MRCIIITAGELGGITLPDIAPGPEDFVICCDGGLAHSRTLGLRPHLLMGDFDSLTEPLPTDLPVQRFPKDKDDTDTMLAVRHGLCLGYRDFLLVAGAGGRLDHTYANLQTLAFLLEEGAVGVLLGANERARLLRSGQVNLPRREGYTLSVFAWGGPARGIWEEGVHFPIEDATLTDHYPLGVSNRITAPEATVRVEEGTLLILECREN